MINYQQLLTAASLIFLGEWVVGVHAFFASVHVHRLHTGSLHHDGVRSSYSYLDTKHHFTKEISDETFSTGKIRAAVYQAPVQSNTQSDNPLAVLTQVADSLRVAAQAGVDLVLYPELYLSGSTKRILDRESYELNIVGNICAELNVACVVGYAEKMGESEIKRANDGGESEGAYNSIAAFNADGSRAGNYRSISKYADETLFREGHPFVESIPLTLQLPNRQEGEQREIKVGIMCGRDALVPEHSRQLVRSGAQALLSLASLRNVDYDQRIVNCMMVRAMENEVPVLYANPEGDDANSEEEMEFIGSSAIISKDGGYLVCAPIEEGGDMIHDVGYLIPCEAGALFAADIDMNSSKSFDIASDNEQVSTSLMQQSLDQWDLTPRVPDILGNRDKVLSTEPRVTNGFAKNLNKRNGKARKLK